jgi:phosphotransferase system HPr (HPr) family protein
MHAEKLTRTKRIRRLFRVSDPFGLHARPASLIAQVAGCFDADISVRCGRAVASGKSLLDLLKLCAGPGELLTIDAEGDDAERSMDMLEGVFRQHTVMTSA